MDSSSLEKLLSWVNTIYIVGVIAVAAASFGLYFLSPRLAALKDRDFQAFKLNAEKEIADAKERTKNAELQLEQLRRQRLPRSVTFNRKAFIEELKDKPSLRGSIWYLPTDDESFEFALSFWAALAVGAGWQHFSQPTPIPPDAVKGDMGPVSIPLPPLLKIGAQSSGVSVVVRKLADHWSENTPQTALFKAITVGTGNVAGSADPTLPTDFVRIIVGPKP